MSVVHILAIDLAKRSFQVCGADRGGAMWTFMDPARLQQVGWIRLACHNC